jgi:hypothetical protein
MKYTTDQLESLRQFATVKQSEYIDAMIANGLNGHKAADAIGINNTTIYRGLESLEKKASAMGAENPKMLPLIPDGLKVKGNSSYINKHGVMAGQWVKTTVDDVRREELMRESIEALKETIPRYTMVDYAPLGNDSLLNCYVITDYHLGMLSWKEETGADWDIKIAENLLLKWFSQAIHQSPDADVAIFAQLSDFLHFDGMDAVTPASKHLLDVDTRFAKLVRVALRLILQIIDMLLQKHKKVHILMLDANHDPVSQIWLREMLAIFYSNNDRVTVDTSPNPYNSYEFGKTALFFHHGHKKKLSDVSKVFVSMYREIFGRTKYAYAHTGHLHHIDVKEDQLMIVEQHRTLAATDAYSARGGWLSGRDAKVITYHKEYGEVSRLTINSDMCK